jgi:hypothetical protein
MSTNIVTPALGPVPPHGLDQILVTFGDIFDYIGPDHTLNPQLAASVSIAHQLWRMLFFSSAAYRNKIVGAFMGNRHRSEYRIECAGDGRKYGSSYR